jgi:hypothetical protein
MPNDTWSQVKGFRSGLQSDLQIPILFEPPGLRDTLPVVEYVQKGSPAERAGILPGDRVDQVTGRETFSRKDAFVSCRAKENPSVTVGRAGAQIGFTLKKPRFASPGFVMYEDLDKDAYVNWERTSRARRGQSALVLTSSLAKPVIDYALSQRGVDAKVVAVKSRFFGGNIQACGLLTVGDFWSAYESVVAGGFSPAEVTLPRIAFDPWGRDLEGVHYKTFAQRCGLPVILAG